MLVAPVWIAPAVLAAVAEIGQRRLHGEAPASTRDLIWAAGDWMVYAFVTPVVFWLTRRWPIARPNLVSRALLHFLFALLFCVVWASSGTLLKMALARTFEPDRFHAMVAAAGDQVWSQLGAEWLSWILTTLPFGVIVYLCLTGIAHAIQYFVEARDRDLQVARLSAQLSGARLAALQAQLNPHFLFNSLNTIAVLVRDGSPAQATRVIEQLSDVLRITLDHTRANEVALEDELELVRQYLAVEQARFSDRLRPEFALEPATLSAAVPSLALQHLVENAVRHGIAKRTGAGRLVVSARRVGAELVLAVEDDGPGIEALAREPIGHGLDTTRERLRTLYGERASLVVARAPRQGTLATLRVPYREILLEPEPDAER
jgi:signal transduction histidine kinase